jgi:hypothetical protein
MYAFLRDGGGACEDLTRFDDISLVSLELWGDQVITAKLILVDPVCNEYGDARLSCVDFIGYLMPRCDSDDVLLLEEGVPLNRGCLCDFRIDAIFLQFHTLIFS